MMEGSKGTPNLAIARQSEFALEDKMQLKEIVDPFEYDKIIVAFSGGKDSTACVLHLLDLGVPVEKAELWHHLVDGRGGNLMDWPVTEAYVRHFASAFGFKLYYSWRERGFEGEMLKENSKSLPIVFETPEGLERYVPKKAQIRTRRMFPMISSNLSVRWCTPMVKIEVGRIALSHQRRFENKKVLFITGERAEESASRAGYNTFELHKMDNREGKRNRRWIDAWRPVHSWKLKQVWDIIQRYKVATHPCYAAGWGRCSCAFCIFSSKEQFATLRQVMPEQYIKFKHYEIEFNHPLHASKKKGDVVLSFLDDWIGNTKPKDVSPELVQKLNARMHEDAMFQDDWKLPAGAFGDQAGPS